MTSNNTIIAPYSFVPLPQKVFAPDWAYNVSHDVPFKDGLDGFIDLELVNHGDICVGSGGKEGTRKDKTGDKEINSVKWARHPEDEDRLVIPGTSVKGMLRNVLEIVSLARLTPDSMYQIRKFSHRILGNNRDGEINDYMEKYIDYSKCCAWLKFNNSTRNWELRKCTGNFNIIKIFDNDLNKFLGVSNSDGIANKEGQNACDKYEIAKKSAVSLDLNKMVQVTCVSVPGAKYTSPFYKVNKVSLDTSIPLTNNSCNGYVVFSNFRIASNPDKEYSYIFPAETEDSPVIVPSSMVDACTSVSSVVTKNYNYLRNHQNTKLGIPVWAFFDKKGTLETIGFAKMPRLLCKHNTKDVTANHQWSSEKEWNIADEVYFSLPEVMFGTVRKKFGHMSFKSRISFTDMVSEKVNATTDIDDKYQVVLSSPKPSFTAMYLEEYQTYSSKGKPRISGYKRYICQENSAKSVSGSVPVSSVLEVLKNSKTFKGRVMFHNLKKEELGALLWCLRFGESIGDSPKSPLYHSLGQGKPYGLGAVQFRKVSVSVADYDTFGMKIIDDDTLDNMVQSFTCLMDKEFEKACGSSNLWSNSVQVQFLRSLAFLHDDKPERKVYNEVGQFSKLRNVAIPPVMKIEEINGKLQPSNDPIDRNMACAGADKLNLLKLGEMYSKNNDYKKILDNLFEDPNNKDVKNNYITERDKLKLVAEKQNRIMKVSCSAVKDFFQSHEYERIVNNQNAISGDLPNTAIENFLKLLKDQNVFSDYDKDFIFNEIVSSWWVNLFISVESKKKERKALLRDIKKHLVSCDVICRFVSSKAYENVLINSAKIPNKQITEFLNGLLQYSSSLTPQDKDYLCKEIFSSKWFNDFKNDKNNKEKSKELIKDVKSKFELQ